MALNTSSVQEVPSTPTLPTIHSTPIYGQLSQGLFSVSPITPQSHGRLHGRESVNSPLNTPGLTPISRRSVPRRTVVDTLRADDVFTPPRMRCLTRRGNISQSNVHQYQVVPSITPETSSGGKRTKIKVKTIVVKGHSSSTSARTSVEERRPYFTLDDRDIFSENDDAESNVAEKTNDESEIFI